MKHTIAHEFDTATAKKVTDLAFAEYQRRYPEYQPTLRWTSERHADVAFNAKGVKMSGAMDLTDGNIIMDLDVPFLFRPFQKKAMEVIDREVQTWLGKAREGQI